LLTPATLGVPVSVPFKLRCMPIGGNPPSGPSSKVYGGVPPEGFVAVEPQMSLPEIGGRQNEYPEVGWPADTPPRFGVVNTSPGDGDPTDGGVVGVVGVVLPPAHDIVSTSDAGQSNETTTRLTLRMILQCFLIMSSGEIYSTSVGALAVPSEPTVGRITVVSTIAGS
jgi:hypothetical protein